MRELRLRKAKQAASSRSTNRRQGIRDWNPVLLLQSFRSYLPCPPRKTLGARESHGKKLGVYSEGHGVLQDVQAFAFAISGLTVGQSREWIRRLQHGATGNRASPGAAPAGTRPPTVCAALAPPSAPHTVTVSAPPRPSPTRSPQPGTLCLSPLACLWSTPPSGSSSRPWPSENLP